MSGAALQLIAIDRLGGTCPAVTGAEGSPLPDVIAATVALYARTSHQPPWICYLALEEGLVLGTCGFAAPPRDGEVELAYFSFPGQEGRGLATRMARALLGQCRLAARQAGLRYIAHTLPEEGPSTTILRKLGFEKLGEIQHPQDGRVWKWRERADSAASP